MALLEGLERHYGPAQQWSLRLKAAVAQLETMQSLMGDEYGPFLDCCNAAFERTFARRGMPTHPADALQVEMMSWYGVPGDGRYEEALDVGYALAYSLTGMLGGPRYEGYRKFMQLAAEVHGEQHRDAMTA